MSDNHLKVSCPTCDRATPVEEGFCCFCGGNLDKSIGVRLEDYQLREDREAISNLDMAKLLLPLVQMFKPPSSSFKQRILRRCVSLDQVPKILDTSKECARILGLDVLPKIYVMNHDVPNAFTFGSDNEPAVLITLGLLKMLKERELKVILGHEMGHIKCKHLSYHVIAEALAGGTNLLGYFVLGRDLLSLPLRMLLLSWHRSSETTADRASLIVAGDVDAVKSAMTKVYFGSRVPPEEMKHLLEGGDESFLEKIGGLLRTHPPVQKRIGKIDEFYRGQAYRKIALKLWEKHILLSEILRCRFCGEPNPENDAFCPHCHRCQT